MPEPAPAAVDEPIPRVLHRVWLGSRPMPAEFERYGESWRRLHPDWEMPLWTDDHAEELGLEDVLPRARSAGELSDLVRYEVLRRHGGVYVDTDFEALRPLDPLLTGIGAFTAYARTGNPKIATGVMGSVLGHPAFEAAADLAHRWLGECPLGETGPWLMTQVLRDFPDVTVFAAELFYPYHWTELHRRDAEFPDAYAVHHWSLRFLEKLYHRHAKAAGKVEELEERLARAAADLEEEKRRRKASEARVEGLERTAWRRLSGTTRRLLHRSASDRRT